MRRNHKATPNTNGTVTVRIKDMFAVDVTHTIIVKQEEYDKWVKGAHVQDAFPTMSRDQREIFVTGIGPDSWNTHIKKYNEDA